MGNCMAKPDDMGAANTASPSPSTPPPEAAATTSGSKGHGSSAPYSSSRAPTSSSSSPTAATRWTAEDQVRDMSVADLKRELRRRNVSMHGMIEKEELVQAILQARGIPPRPTNHAGRTPPASSSPTTSNSSSYPSPPPSPTRPSAASSSSPRPSSSSSSPPSSPSARKTYGKVAKSAANHSKMHLGEDVVDPSRWRTNEVRFNGSCSFATIGQQENVKGSISGGKALLRDNPDKYAGMTHQSNMVDWPVTQQQYLLVHREGTEGYKPQGVGPRGAFTGVFVTYARCQPFPNDELPRQFRDQYTDIMTYNRRKLHSSSRKPIMPGRGMGVGDAPNLKIIGDVDPSDINQGTVGNCWMLSAISALAEFDGAIRHLFRKTPHLDQMPRDGPNMYTISLFDLTNWQEVDIQIDERLCVQSNGNGKLLGAHPSKDGELWVCYLEKALAAHAGGWDKIQGGQCTHAWSLLTGCKDQYTVRKNPKTGRYGCYAKYNPHTGQWGQHANSPHDCDQRTWQVSWPDVGGGGDGEITQEELFMKMCAWDDENYIVGAGVDGVSDKKTTDGMVNNHAYSVIEAHNDVAGTDIDLFKVRNPWGKGEIENGEFDDDGPGWNRYPQVKRALNPVVADDGIFYLTKKEFFHHFSTIYLSASNMTEFLED